MSPYESMTGVEIVVSEQLGRRLIQVRFPRSKKRRIRKKWARRRENWAWVYIPRIWRVGDTIYMDPQSYARVMEATRPVAQPSVGFMRSRYAGLVSVPDSFFEPLPDDLLNLFNGGEE